jgi:hypothetical protein
MKSLARTECYTIWESAGIIEYRRLGRLVLSLKPVKRACCAWPKKSKGVKIPAFKYARAKFLDYPGAYDVQRVGDLGRARIEPKRRVKWRK